jgi:hypothetical protein
MISRQICPSFKWSLVSLFLFSALAGNLSPVAWCKAPTTPVKTWQLRGRVTDERGRPVGGARVFTNELPYSASAKQSVRPEGGIPWTVILDENGEPLITSDGPNGNIGYPGEPEGRVHFEKMLRADVKKLTDDEIKTLIDALAKAKK